MTQHDFGALLQALEVLDRFHISRDSESDDRDKRLPFISPVSRDCIGKRRQCAAICDAVGVTRQRMNRSTYSAPRPHAW